MGQLAAKQGYQIIATDTHIVMVPGSPSPVPTPQPHPFNGIINGWLSSDVNIVGLPAATVHSTADNTPPHTPTPPGSAFQNPPTNKGVVKMGSPSVNINGKPAARNGDPAETCNDPAPLLAGTVVVVSGTVFIG
ncbi:MAG: PAAR domain-containing protein [Candidatus Thorarchaeota archaeon]